MKSTFARSLEAWIGDRRYEDVAPLLGAAFGTIHSWRHGESVPHACRIPALAIAMSVPESKLRKVIARDRARIDQSKKGHRADRAPVGATATVDEGDATDVGGAR